MNRTRNERKSWMKSIRLIIGLTAAAAVIMPAAGCGQWNAKRDETPLSVDDRNWKQFGVDDPRLADWTDMHDNARLETANDLELIVEKLDRVQDAVVIRTDLNAYVGVKLAAMNAGEGDEMSRDMRARIILAVKSADTMLKNVYVSSRPEVYKTIADYNRKLTNGVPGRSLVQSFNTRMRQQFPFSELGQ